MCKCDVRQRRKNGLRNKEQATVRTGDDATRHSERKPSLRIRYRNVLSRFTELAVAKDYLGMAGMEGAGQVFPVPSGTKVKVIDRGVITSEVRVMEGQHIGDSGFVPAEFVTK